MIAEIGYLLCALGTPCIYYGTEQGLEGSGGDNDLREALFEAGTPGVSLLNTECRIYREIGRIAAAMRRIEPLRFGRMYFREISGDGEHFGLPFGSQYTLAFSRVLYRQEMLVAYNVSDQPRSDHKAVDSSLHAAEDMMHFLYGGNGAVQVRQSPSGARSVHLELAPYQFVIIQ